MAQVTNNSDRTPIGLPNGVLVAPQQTVEVKGWDKVKGHKIIAYYLKHGILTVDGDSAKASGGGDDKDELLAKLKALGIDAGKNSGVESLQKRLAEAEAKAKEDAIAKLKEKGIQVGDDVTLEELQAELAKHP
ncbi:hypothetical protein [Pseudomonas bharatica]|uniref:hypothetical protein n=1 Tax=Pseudomonas bharatica TaxID=2692112 RepID=UPI003B27B706